VCVIIYKVAVPSGEVVNEVNTLGFNIRGLLRLEHMKVDCEWQNMITSAYCDLPVYYKV
jgi:hypothetical protein